MCTTDDPTYPPVASSSVPVSLLPSGSLAVSALSIAGKGVVRPTSVFNPKKDASRGVRGCTAAVAVDCIVLVLGTDREEVSPKRADCSVVNKSIKAGF